MTDKSARPKRAGQLEKIPEGSFRKKSSIASPDKKDDKLATLTKAMKMSEEELKFLKEYRALEDLEREKGIKFFECIGDPPATDEFK